MKFESKYNIGDTVFFATTIGTKRQKPCPDCLGKRSWKAVAPSGKEYSFSCPRCSANYNSDQDITLDYFEHVPVAEKLTIGLIHGLDEKGEFEYMCDETGIGSGSIYRESKLHDTEENAMSAAKLLAASANDHVKKTNPNWEARLRVCDYQLSDAALARAKELRSEADSILQRRYYDLVDYIHDAAGTTGIDPDKLIDWINEQKWRAD